MNEQGKVLKNGQLFNAIRKNKSSKDKLRKVQKHLDEGADINARDANNKNNTPLHIAVINDEKDIVKLLVDAGANIDIKNADGETALDIAKLINTPNRIEIVDILSKECSDSALQTFKQEVLVEHSSLVKNTQSEHFIQVKTLEEQSQAAGTSSVQQVKEKRVTEDSKRNEQNESQCLYRKRPGTAGISGHLYETKLSMLLLLRALNDKGIDKFYIGTNVDEIGALDDVVFRYNSNRRLKSRVIFLQAKHRDDPDKYKLTVGEVLKKDGDFSLHKYLDSYMRIKQKFKANNDDVVFKSEFQEVDCDFVIYTPAEESFHKKVEVDPDKFFRTTAKGKTFQMEYDDSDINTLLETSANVRIKMLAENFVKFLFHKHADKYEYMMCDKLIASYHVVLAQKVILVSKEVFKVNQQKPFRKGIFRDDFFSSNFSDCPLLCAFRKSLFEETVYCKEILLENKKIKKLVDQLLENPSPDILKNLIGNVLRFDAKNNVLKFRNEISKEITIQLESNLKKKKIAYEIVEEAIKLAAEERLKSFKFEEVQAVAVECVTTKNVTAKNLTAKKGTAKNATPKNVNPKECYIKLPDTFGNLDLKVTKKGRTDYLAKKFIELLKDADVDNIIKINNAMIGDGRKKECNKKLKKGDVQINGGIGGLIGNLIILEEETELLKFNNNYEILLENAKTVVKNLESKILNEEELRNKALSSYRFDVDVDVFPKLSFNDKTSDKQLVEDFLHKLTFYTNQAKEEEIENILKNGIDEHYNAEQKINEFIFHVKSDAIFLKVHDEVQKWWKQPKKAPYLTESCKFFEEAQKDVVDNPLLTFLNFMHINKLRENDIVFSHDAIKILELDKFMKDPQKRILNITTDEIMLSSMKLLQYFERKTSTIFMDLDYVLKIGRYKEAVSEFEEAVQNILIGFIECYTGREINENIEELYRELKRVMNNECKSSKLIIITKENDLLANKLKGGFSDKYIEYKDENNNLINLTPESQLELLAKQAVIFQEEKVNLANLITDQKLKYLIDVKVLTKLINNEKIEIGTALPDLDKIKHYYIDRIFNRRITVKKDCLEKHLPDLFAISNIEINELCRIVYGRAQNRSPKTHKFRENDSDKRVRNFTDRDPEKGKPIRFIALDDEIAQDNFKQLCYDYPNHSIHWLKRENGKLIWQQSYGALSNIRKYVDDSSKKYIKTKELINERNNKVIIISAKPGMGKSTVMTKLAQEIKEHFPFVWTIRINLYNLIAKGLDKVDFKKDDALEFLVKALDLEDETLGKNLFIYYLNIPGKIVLFLDGFDEICPNYSEKCIDLLKILNETQVNQIFISTRGYVQRELEDAFSTLSYTLEPFSPPDQTQFLRRFWQNTLNLNQEEQLWKNSRFEKYSAQLRKLFSCSISDKKKDFCGIPMLLEMLAENHINKFKNYLTSEADKLPSHFTEGNFNLLTLYEDFIEKKYNIFHFIKQRKIKENPGTIEEIEELKKTFVKKHKLLAAQRILSEHELESLLTVKEKLQLEELIRKINSGEEKTGIINKVIGDKPEFIHLSFAEYFVAALFVDMLDKPKSYPNQDTIRDFLCEHIFEKKYGTIRNFFDHMLAEDVHDKNNLTVHTAVLNKSKKHVELLPDVNALDRGGRTALHLAAAYGYEEIVQVLLNKLSEEFLRQNLKLKDKLFDWSPLTYAAQSSSWSTAKLLLDKGARINDIKQMQNVNSVDKEGTTLLHFIVTHTSDIGIVKFLLEKGSNIDAKGISGSTCLHIAAESGKKEAVDILINYAKETKSEEIFRQFINAKDATKRSTALHLAASVGHKEIVQALLSNHADIESADEDGCTPLHRAVVSGKKDIAEILLLNNANVEARDCNLNTPLHEAVNWQHKDIAEVLLQYNADVNAVNNLSRPAFFLLLFPDICFLREQKTIDFLNLLLDNGAEILTDSDMHELMLNFTPLDSGFKFQKISDIYYNTYYLFEIVIHPTSAYRLFYSDKLQCITQLIEKGASVNAKYKGWTPLHYAVKSGDINITNILLTNGADATRTTSTKGNSPLHLAALKGNKKIIEILLEHMKQKHHDKLNSLVNARTHKKGVSPLHVAVENGHLTIVILLLDHGAGLHIKDNNGKTPLDLAKEKLAQDPGNGNLKNIVDTLYPQV